MVVPHPWIYMSLSFVYDESLYVSFIRDCKIQQRDENENVLKSVRFNKQSNNFA